MNPIHASALALPIYEKREEIISALRSNQAIVVAGQTGSGKTTQLPLFCLDAGRGRIACTQPRRIAATSIAARVAAQMGCAVGGRVGYRIRFAAKESAHTAVTFMTDGILLAEAETDRGFSRYDTIIIDEAHERNLNIDFLLGYLRTLLPRRPNLKLVISSATIDAEGFSKSFGGAPVIEASGRMFPIETLYRAPGDAEESGGYVEDAVAAASDLLDVYGPGDMLVFMPTERDIRETCDKLEGMVRARGILTLPLFSRLTRAEQDAIFNPGDRTRIVVCTNIAETSITVPNIRYVVDTGLARVPRYAPRLRTNRLPIEPISRASADQRKGRCGRVRDGVCVRLYSEDDFMVRDEFTQPEIRRSNLAGVILTMAAHNLGSIDRFPFMEPPSKQAISEGYAQLTELGAIDGAKKLTPMGREMARLPFDPHISRMIIAARAENALREVKIIAAALSIVDPRERPFDKQAEADAAHAKFADRSSDFLTYVNIWDAFRAEWDALRTQGGVRRFCKDHFLSYTRMREWHDVHQQLEETLSRMKDYPQNGARAAPDAIHRSLLAGLLANCAYMDKNGKYKAAGGREVTVFPGSALAKAKRDWIMCHEIVETSRVFARTVAGVSPLWIEELAAGFCKRAFDSPFFDPETGYVRATERVTVFGMPLAVRKNALYSRAEPKAASEIFIREGLVEERAVCRHPFYEHNKKVKGKILLLEEKLRSRAYYAGDDAVFDFYAERLPLAASVRDLDRAIWKAGGDGFLFMREEDILSAAIPDGAQDFPDHVSIGSRNFALKYAFEPGAARDGVTLALPRKALPFIDRETLGWLLPALWPDRIKDLLRQLPRGQRKAFIPVNEAAARLAGALAPDAEGRGPFAAALSAAIKREYGIDVAPALLEPERAPPHLDLKIEVRGDDGSVVAEGRGGDVLDRLKDAAAPAPADGADSPWEGAFASYRKPGLLAWPDGDLSAPVDVGSSSGGLPVRGFPALVPGEGPNGGVDLVLFPSKARSDAAHRAGARRLLELALERDLSWTERDMPLTGQIRMMCAPFGTGEAFRRSLYDMICAAALEFGEAPRRAEDFDRMAAAAKESLRGIGFRVMSVFEESLRAFAENASRLAAARGKFAPDVAGGLSAALNAFFEDILAGRATLDVFLQYPRYLKAFAAMMEKASFDPLKYRRKAASVAVYRSMLETLRGRPAAEGRAHVRERLLGEFAQMIREYEISLFAQHIKTLYPVSEKRLDGKAGDIKGFCL